MLDPGTAVTVLGTASSLGAAACGVKVVQAHREIVEGVSRTLRRAWHEVTDEPVPRDMLDRLDRLAGGEELNS